MAISYYQMPNFRRRNPSSVRFQCTYPHTNVGEEICLVGDVEELGQWDISKRIRLSTNANIFPKWMSPILTISSSSPIYYKYIITPACTCRKGNAKFGKCTCINTNQNITWESAVGKETDGNRELNLSQIHPILVVDNFNTVKSEIQTLIPEIEPEPVMNPINSEHHLDNNNILYGSHHTRLLSPKEDPRKISDGYMTEDCVTPVRFSSHPVHLNPGIDAKHSNIDSTMYLQMLKNVEWTCKMCSSQVNELKDMIDIRLRRLSTSQNSTNIDKSLLEEYSAIVSNASTTAFKNAGPEIIEPIFQRVLNSTLQGEYQGINNKSNPSSLNNEALDAMRLEISAITSGIADLKRENHVFRQLIGYMCGVLDQLVAPTHRQNNMQRQKDILCNGKQHTECHENIENSINFTEEYSNYDISTPKTMSPVQSQYDLIPEGIINDRETDFEEPLQTIEEDNINSSKTKSQRADIASAQEGFKKAKSKSQSGFPKIYVADNAEGMNWIDWACRNKGLSC